MDLSPDALFTYFNYGVLPFWLLLVVLPHWSGTQWLVHSVIAPLALGVAYALFISGVFASAPSGATFSSLEGVMVFFSVPEAVLAGWVHYLVFDLFVGAWQVRDAKRRGISHWFVIPCLFFTLMAGPIGLMLYLLIRIALGKGSFTLMEDRGH